MLRSPQKKKNISKKNELCSSLEKYTQGLQIPHRSFSTHHSSSVQQLCSAANISMVCKPYVEYVPLNPVMYRILSPGWGVFRVKTLNSSYHEIDFLMSLDDDTKVSDYPVVVLCKL